MVENTQNPPANKSKSSGPNLWIILIIIIIIFIILVVLAILFVRSYYNL